MPMQRSNFSHCADASAYTQGMTAHLLHHQAYTFQLGIQNFHIFCKIKDQHEAIRCVVDFCQKGTLSSSLVQAVKWRSRVHSWEQFCRYLCWWNNSLCFPLYPNVFGWPTWKVSVPYQHSYHPLDWMCRTLITSIKNLGLYCCFRCLVAMPQIGNVGQMQDLMWRIWCKHKITAVEEERLHTARKLIFLGRYRVNSARVVSLLKDWSLAPIKVRNQIKIIYRYLRL